jgi:hypothetical protein
MDEHSNLAAFSQTASLALQCALRSDRTRLAPRFIGLVEGFLTPLPAERPKQTPLFFIFSATGARRRPTELEQDMKERRKRRSQMLS